MKISPPKILFRVIYIILALLFLAFRSEAVSNSEISKSFDQLVTRDFMASALIKEIPFSFNVFDVESQRIYEGALFFEDDNSSHYIFRFVIAGAGTFLSEDSYQAYKAEVKESFADRGKEYLEYRFPDVGYRAQQDTVIAGIQGSNYGIIFTTSDQKYDVRVIISMSLPMNMADPGFNPEVMARKLSQSYDRKNSSNDQKKQQRQKDN